MQLGMNVIHATQEWSTFRPYNHEGRQAAPPFKGDWANRVYVDELVPGETYICVLSDHGTIQGEYSVRAFAPAQCALRSYVAGDFGMGGPYRYVFGRDNVWIQLEVAQPCRLADLRIEIRKDDKDDTAPPWNNDFLAAIKPFKRWRAMDMCGVGSRVRRVRTSAEFGGFARGPVAWNDLTEFGKFGEETGCNPLLWFPPGMDEVWINMPVLIAADPSARAQWLAEVWKFSGHVKKVRVAIGNEVWANNTAVGQLLLSFAGKFDPDSSVGRCLILLTLTVQLKQLIHDMRLQDRFEAICEWQMDGRWPFSYDRHLNRYVSLEARSMLRDIGHVAIAPYPGRGITSLDQLAESVADELVMVQAWAALAQELEIDVHCYEAGLELRHGPESWKNDQRSINGAIQLLAGLNAKLAPNSTVNWYGLCGNVSYGALHTLTNRTEPLYLALSQWAADYNA